MVKIEAMKFDDSSVINKIVDIHLKTFTGFFLTFMGRGFLYQMYKSYCQHEFSGILIAREGDKIVGFLAYSSDFSGLYKFMIKTHLIQFAWYSLGAFLRRPSAFLHIIKAFLKPSEVKRVENYVELSSIGVDPDEKFKGIGTLLIDELKRMVDFNKYEYITLETDATNNDGTIKFYEKNNFFIARTFVTSEGRKMYEYRFVGERE